ncbi:hypothetical protein [Phenylobacterium sp.]|uniref:hypothetical protein n=1 Tax=Phenylobacterium sp. TaxID=1871053 RepID=UPI0035ADA776
MPNANDCAELQALFEGVDGARKAVEMEWGAERLPLLVGDEWRTKFRKQQAKWSALLQDAWQAERITGDQMQAVRSAAGGMVRGYAKLAEVAVEAGHRPIFPDVWEFPLEDGSVAAFVRSNDEAAKVIADGRYLQVYTLAEVATLINTLVPESLQLAKVVFPGAKFTSTDRSWVKDGDEIPFPKEAA